MTTPIHVRASEEEARPGSSTGSEAWTGSPPKVVPPSPRLLFRRAVLAALATTAAVTAVSWLVPKYAATLVGLVFLGATWLLVLRGDEQTIRRHGLSLGGLLEPVAIDPRRVLREALDSLGWVVLLMLLLFPPFWLGFRVYWGLHGGFHLRLPPSIGDEIMGQVLVTALPEEAFFRGYQKLEGVERAG